MLELLAVSIEGDVTKRESPDFAFTLFDGTKIGLEVTDACDPKVAEVWNGVGPRLQEAVRSRLTRLEVKASIAGRLEASGATALNRRAVLDATADQIVSVAAESIRTGVPLIRKQLLPHARIYNVQWSPLPFASFVMRGDPLGPDLIQVAIDEKSELLDSYRKMNADAYWLLVVGGKPLSGYVTIADARSRAFVSPFDRTLFLDLSDGACVDLATEAGPTS